MRATSAVLVALLVPSAAYSQCVGSTFKFCLDLSWEGQWESHFITITNESEAPYFITSVEFTHMPDRFGDPRLWPPELGQVPYFASYNWVYDVPMFVSAPMNDPVTWTTTGGANELFFGLRGPDLVRGGLAPRCSAIDYLVIMELVDYWCGGMHITFLDRGWMSYDALPIRPGTIDHSYHLTVTAFDAEHYANTGEVITSTFTTVPLTTTAPEPAGLLLVATGLLGIGGLVLRARWTQETG